MKKTILILAFCALLAAPAWSQNWATFTANNLTDLNQQKLAAGQICFLATDQTDTPISFQAGGGGQVLKRAFCSAVNAGVATAFTVPNPAAASPGGIYYRVTVRDSSTGQEVLRYTGVTFSGATFNFDTYTPVLPGASLAPLTGTSVSGNLGVSGNISATGTIAGSNIPAAIAGTGSCAGQFVNALNTGAAPTCSTTLNQGAGSGPFLTTGNVNPAYLDGSTGAGGTGGLIEFTSGPDTLSGYSAWILQNALFNGTNWIAPRGSGLSSHALAVSHHRNFSFNFAASPGTNGAPITWTEWANLSSIGFNLESGNYLVNGSQISFANIAGTAAQAQVPWASPGSIGATTPNAGAFTTVSATSTATVKRLKMSNGTALSAADFSFSAGWGSTASIGSVAGTDSAFTFLMTSNGTGQTANPNVVITFHDGTWTTPPICVVSGLQGNASTVGWEVQNPTVTSVVLLLTSPVTPGATGSYGANVICVGR